MIPFEVPRTDLVDSLAAKAQGRAVLLAGPPGVGKSWILRALVEQLSAQGALPILIDLFGAASSPDRFVTAVLAALPAGPLASSLPMATRLRVLADGGRSRGAEAIGALFDFLASLSDAGGRPIVLLLDEATEIRSLAYFKGLRDVHEPFREMLERRRAGTILATSFATLARKLWPSLASRFLPLLTAEEVFAALPPSARNQADAFWRLTAGFPRYAHVLFPSVAAGEPVELAFTSAMRPGGPLELACRQTYESLLLRSRGYGMAKAVLATVAREEGLNLTPLVARLGRTPGATRDYLQWLLDVDALRREGKRYFFVDPMLRAWVRLYTAGTLPTTASVRAMAAELGAPPRPLAATPATAAAPAAPPDPPAEEPPPPRPLPRADTLMEID
jgi:AAA domain